MPSAKKQKKNQAKEHEAAATPAPVTATPTTAPTAASKGGRRRRPLPRTPPPSARELALQLVWLATAAAAGLGLALVLAPDAASGTVFRAGLAAPLEGLRAAWAVAGLEALCWSLSLLGVALAGHATKELMMMQVLGLLLAVCVGVFGHSSFSASVTHEGPAMGAVMGAFMLCGCLATGLSVAPDLATLKAPVRGTGTFAGIIRATMAGLSTPSILVRLFSPSTAAGLAGVRDADTSEVAIAVAVGAVLALQNLMVVVAAGESAPVPFLATLAAANLGTGVFYNYAALAGSPAALFGLGSAHAALGAVYAVAVFRERAAQRKATESTRTAKAE